MSFEILLTGVDGEAVTALVFGVASMAFDPFDGDLVLRELFEDLFPEVRVQCGLLIFLA